MVRQSFFKIPLHKKTEHTDQSFYEKLIISCFRRRSLRTKVIAFTFLIGTLPFLGVGGVTYYSLNKSATKEITQNQQDKVNFLTKNISNFMLRRYGDIEILSQLNFLQYRNLRRVMSREQIQSRLSNYLNSVY